ACIEGFVHSVRDQEVDDEYIALAKEHNIWITPNLGGINRASLIRENGRPDWLDEPLVRQSVSPALIRGREKLYDERKRAGTPPSPYGRVFEHINTRQPHAPRIPDVPACD